MDEFGNGAAAPYVLRRRVDRTITSRTYQLKTWRGFADADPALSVVLVSGCTLLMAAAIVLREFPIIAIPISIAALLIAAIGFKILRAIARYDEHYFHILAQSTDPYRSWRGGPRENVYLFLKRLGTWLENVRLLVLTPVLFAIELIRYILADSLSSIGILLAIVATFAIGFVAGGLHSPGDAVANILATATKYGREISLVELAIIIAFAQILAGSIGQARQTLDARLSIRAEQLKASCLALRAIMSDDLGKTTLDADFRRKQIGLVSELLNELISNRALLSTPDPALLGSLRWQIHDSVAIQYVHDEFFEEIKAYCHLLFLSSWLARRATFGWIVLGAIAAYVTGLAILPLIPSWAVLIGAFLTLVTASQAARRQLDI